MIAVNEKKKLDFVTIGLFDTDAEWIHPTVTVETYELIYVTAGCVQMFEGDQRYTLGVGDALLLSPGIVHGGTLVSTGHTAFYWLHFYCDDVAAWGLFKQQALPPTAEKSLREIMHLNGEDRELAEVALARFLLETRTHGACKSKLAYEVREYVRIHAAKGVRVDELAERFGYSGDHLSRVYKQEFGHDLKAGITKARLLQIESLLLNTEASVKEIAETCGFADENLFLKFFKYHEKMTPREYRNRCFHIHMNNK